MVDELALEPFRTGALDRSLTPRSFMTEERAIPGGLVAGNMRTSFGDSQRYGRNQSGNTDPLVFAAVTTMAR